MNGLGSTPRADCAAGVFPALDADLDDEPCERSRTTKRICIATPDILGPVKNGGIGTAYHHLARSLAEWGHEVVIAYVARNAADAPLMEKACILYSGLGVAFEPIVPRPAAKTALARVAAPTWALYDWLRKRDRPFDIVHVSEWRGLGYGALLAKSLGIAFGATHFVVKGSSPTLWTAEGNRQLLSKEHELGWVFMERRSIELADTVICGSAHLLGWMREAGYAMPARSFVWPNVFPAPDPSPAAAARRAARDGAALEEVVFFGRLEPRKGLVLFIDAIDRLVSRGRAPARVTFLGKASNRIDGPGVIRNSARDWPIKVRTITDFGTEEAVAYLAQPGRLAVIPSLLENSSIAVMECLQAGIPFVAAASGGTPELIAPEDHARTLVAPDHIVLGERIAELVAAPLRAVRPRWDFERSLEVWSRWHAQSTPFAAAAERFAKRAHIAGAETPLVTVCIVHHERPALVRMAVDSVFAQNYPALEAVLVDDGSESAGALETLDALEAEFAERGWRVVRQENRYLGAARNAAAAVARGEWLLFLDDDNVLFPDAVSRLLRAARFSGADCVPAASIRFHGDGDPRTDTESRDTPIRFLGAARAWSRLRNVVGDSCALVRREAFEAVGGFTEDYRIGARRSVLLQPPHPCRPADRTLAGPCLLLPLRQDEHEDSQPLDRGRAGPYPRALPPTLARRGAGLLPSRRRSHLRPGETSPPRGGLGAHQGLAMDLAALRPVGALENRAPALREACKPASLPWEIAAANKRAKLEVFAESSVNKNEQARGHGCCHRQLRDELPETSGCSFSRMLDALLGFGFRQCCLIESPGSATALIGIDLRPRLTGVPDQVLQHLRAAALLVFASRTFASMFKASTLTSKSLMYVRIRFASRLSSRIDFWIPVKRSTAFINRSSLPAPISVPIE